MRRAFFGVLLLLVPVAASAALVPDYSTLQLDMSPRYPAPGSSVTLSLVNTAPNAALETYTWTVDGNLVLKGIGETRLALIAGAAGKIQEVTVTATDDSGSIVGSASAVINPATVDVVWEGDTSVPPLYEGRPLPNGQSSITTLAVPRIAVDGTPVAATALIYTWSVDGIPKVDQSGYGKNSATFTPPRFGAPFRVSVHAETKDGRGGADGSATITPQTPSVMLYENAPLLGIRFDHAIGNSFTLAESEASFSGFPLFIGNLSALSYTWALDGSAFSVDSARPLDVTLRKVNEGSGTHQVTVSFTNPSSFLEEGNTTFSLNL